MIFQEDEFKPGFFDPETNEYILDDPRTPMPWMHYLFNKEYTALISVTGGGYSFHKTAKDRRILRMRPNNVPFDRPGRYIYIRNNKEGDYFSANWAPVMKPLNEQSFRCRLGAGYMTINSVYRNIHTQLSYFVPLNDNLEVWRFSIKNHGNTELDLSLFTYAEFALFDAVNDRDNYQYTYNIASAFCEGNTIYHNTRFPIAKILAFFTSSLDIAGYECNREKFIGPHNTEANPRGVLRGSLTSKGVSGNNPCGVHQINLQLLPGAEKELFFLLGITEKKEEAHRIIKLYQQPGYPEKILKEVTAEWKDIFQRFIFNTPSDEINAFSNFWHPYQMRTTFYLSRGPSIYEGGIGRGMGFRDSNQDTLGPAYQVGAELKTLLLELTHFQYESGYAAHGYFRFTNEGYGSKYSDDHLWLILSVTNYIKETGDLAFLDTIIPFYNSASQGTVFEHLKRALDFTRNNCGDHKMPLAFNADWNDCLNLQGPKGKGESVWVGFLYHKTLLDFIELCKVLDKDALAMEYERYAKDMCAQINARAWDKDWYLRAFDDNGDVIGSHQNQNGKLFLNAQTWAVFSQVASPERGKSAMDMVYEKCNSEHGLTLLWPAYTEYNPLIGSISLYPPGLKENAGIFCHANTWAVIAECLLGRGDYAMEYYKKLLPPQYNRSAAQYHAEPYVYSQVIAGPEHPDFGLARNSWLTGTASWMFIAFTQYILGIRPDYNGLLIDPCLPSSWKGYKAQRLFRENIYSIEVDNPHHVCKGVKEILVDGKKLEGALIPIDSTGKGKTIRVKVQMGK